MVIAEIGAAAEHPVFFVKVTIHPDIGWILIIRFCCSADEIVCSDTLGAG